MAVTPLDLQSCTMGFSDKCLRHAVNFEAERACRSIFGRCLRFNYFLAPNNLTSSLRSKHKFSEKLLKGVDGFEKESVFIGYNSLDGLAGNDRSREKFRENFKAGSAEFDATLTCKQFPSISLGCFPTVDLYDGPAYYTQTTETLVPQVLEGCIPSRIDANLLDPNCITQHLNTLYEEVSNMNEHHVLEDDFNKSPTYSESLDCKTEPRNALQLTTNKPCSYAGSETQVSAVSVAEILDESIDCIGLSNRQRSQLENCGFFTLRKLLHHFPRTYVDLQNAEVDIEDGQYMIFVGKIMSSRGVRATSSFSYLEVIVASDVADIEQNANGTADEVEKRRKRTIYLHLKKFFRGARFTCMPFLRSIQGKHKEGDTVCVSGKVEWFK